MAKKEIAPTQCRIILIVLIPATVLVLYGLTFIKPEQNIFREVLGLSASVFGLAGVLIFYIYLYKYQKNSDADLHQRQMMLVYHTVSVVGMFLIVQWLGLYSPWSGELLWGTYDLRDVCKIVIVGILSVGSLSLIGAVFNLLWKLYSTRAS